MLPKLAFFNSKAVANDGINSMRDHIESVVPGIEAVDTLCKPTEFRSISSVVNINRISIAVHTHDPISVRRRETSNNLAFVIPFAGSIEYKVGNSMHRAVANDSGVFLSGKARSAETDVLSEVIVGLDKYRLKLIAQVMSGNECYSEESLRLEEDRSVKLKEGGRNFSAVFQNLFSMIDAHPANQSLLEQMAVDDAFYRAIAMLLDPELSTRQAVLMRQTSDQIELLCEYIRENLLGTISLTDLERVSGLSTRSLQYAFAKKFACSPMQWIRDQRLCLAHDLFKNATDATTISQVAAQLDYFNFGNFARLYKQKFGELPSDTIQKHR